VNAVPTSQNKLQQHRLRMTLLSVVNFAMQAGIMALYAIGGSVDWTVVLAFLVVSVGTSAFFWLVIRTGLNLRLKDPGMLATQIISSWLVQAVFLAIAPQLAVVFLVCMLVGYNHAMITFQGRQFTLSWLVQGAVTGLALLVGHERFGYPGASTLDIVVLWLFFFLCTYRLTAIGLQYATLRAKLSVKNDELSKSLQRIEELASHDDLTGLLNRRSFMTLLEAERQRFLRTGQIFCVGILDIDHFKSVNDRYGHQVGDAVLKEFSRVAAACVRGSDVFARYGGEEFIVLLTAPSTVEAAERALDRLRRAVESNRWEEITPGRAVTLSAGIACALPNEAVEQIISRADHALYAAKEGGRNRVVCAGC
jgi:diguanylate cyclase